MTDREKQLRTIHKDGRGDIIQEGGAILDLCSRAVFYMMMGPSRFETFMNASSSGAAAWGNRIP